MRENIDLILARASLAAYQNKAKVQEALGAEKCLSILDERTGTECFIASTETELFIVFKGAKAKTDFLTDLLSFKTVAQLYHVHWGFFSAYVSVQHHITKAICSNLGKKIYFTGHGVGGALAAVGGLLTHAPHKEIVTFGQPRITDYKGAAELSGMMYRRYVNHSDIVPKVPRLRYSHGGDCYYFTKDRTLLINPPKKVQCKDRWLSFGGEHSMETYLALIEEHGARQ